MRKAGVIGYLVLSLLFVSLSEDDLPLETKTQGWNLADKDPKQTRRIHVSVFMFIYTSH